MNHNEFVTTGKVKNQRVVVVGDPDNSIIIHSLRGVPPDFAEDDSARFGRMPLNAASFFKPEEIDEIADWIKRGCPNGGGGLPTS
jgi:hypothetical protein